MLIELCVHTLVPGQLDAWLALADGVLHPRRREAGARMLFQTLGDTGPLNEVVVAWAHDSMGAAGQVEQTLRANARWCQTAREAGALLRRATRQWVQTTAFTTVTLPPQGTRLVDLRTYSFLPERLQDFLPVCESDGLPRQREHCGALVFHGTSLSGRADQLVQAWAYRDHADYERGQQALFRDADWARGYRARVIHLVDEQEHRLLKTLAGSPQAGAA